MHAKGRSDAFSSPLAVLNFTLDVADIEGSKSVEAIGEGVQVTILCYSHPPNCIVIMHGGAQVLHPSCCGPK